MQKKVSISIDSSVLEEVNKILKQGIIKKRSQIIEQIIKEYFKKQKVKQAVILAGGKTPRINQKEFNKNLYSLASNGIEEIYIITNLKDWDWIKIPKIIKLIFIKENFPLGTAGALWLVKEKIKSRFFIILCDISFDIDLSEMVSSHINSGSIATMGITTTERRLSTDTIFLEGNKIKKFSYKVKPKEKSFLTNAGIYLFEKKIFSLIPKNGLLENKVFPELAKKDNLNSFMFNKNWRHITHGR